MKTIWKFKIDTDMVLSLPKGAKVLSVAEQFGDVNMWVLVDNDAEFENRKFTLYGTGHHIHDDNIQFLGTVCMMGGRFVVHAFEIIGDVS